MKRLNFGSNGDNTARNYIGKSLVFAVFYVVLAFFCPIGRFCLPPAVAATSVASESFRKTKKGTEKELELSEHEYSHFTRRLLKTVSGLLKKIEEVRNSKKDESGVVEEALKEVKMCKKELQDEIMKGLYAELRILRTEKGALAQRSKELLDGVLKVNREEESLRRKAKSGQGEGVQEMIAKVEEEMRSSEMEYNAIWEKIGEIDDHIFRRETMALSIGVRELSFIERECEQLVEACLREMRQRNINR